MNYLQFQNAFKKYTVFSLGEILKEDPRFYRRRLSEWQQKGYIQKIIKGHYIFTDLELNEPRLFEIANKIYSPSYISFEMALSYHGLIPESVYTITSASTRRTYQFKTPIATFKYQTIKEKLFFGYDLIESTGKYFKMASIEKAVLDYFYIHPQINTKDDFESLRFQKETFLKNVNQKKLNQFLARFSKKSLTKRIHLFLRYLKND